MTSGGLEVGRDFEQHREAEIDATPEQVWAAIATGPGIDSWFMGRSEVEPGEGGVVRTAFGGYTPEHRVTVWQPNERFAYRSDEDDDGFIASEFLIEGRAGGSTVVHMVTSGFLPGDDWEDEYDAMTKGTDLFFSTLVEYLRHFAGRIATPVTAFGPAVAHWPAAWATLREALGLTEPVAAGDEVHAAPDGLPPIQGVVYFLNSHTLGVRASDALYRFLQGFHGPMVVGHHMFTEVDADETERAWQSWLDRLFAPA